MNISSKIIALIYGILGFIFVAVGIVGLFAPDSGVPPMDVSDNFRDAYLQLSNSIKHFTMELAASVIALGSLLMWGCFNTSKTRKLDYLFIGYFVLFGGLHWFEFIQGNRTISSPLINSIPLLLFVLVYFLRDKKQ